MDRVLGPPSDRLPAPNVGPVAVPEASGRKSAVPRQGIPHPSRLLILAAACAATVGSRSLEATSDHGLAPDGRLRAMIGEWAVQGHAGLERLPVVLSAKGEWLVPDRSLALTYRDRSGREVLRQNWRYDGFRGQYVCHFQTANRRRAFRAGASPLPPTHAMVLVLNHPDPRTASPRTMILRYRYHSEGRFTTQWNFTDGGNEVAMARLEHLRLPV